MYIYSLKDNKDLKKLDKNNLIADLMEILGIYKEYKENNGLETYEDFLKYYLSIKSNAEYYPARHFRNLGELEIKSIYNDKISNMSRKSLRRFCSFNFIPDEIGYMSNTKKNFRVKTHEKSGELYSIIFKYLFNESKNAIPRKIFIYLLIDKNKDIESELSSIDDIGEVSRNLARKILYFQYKSISQHLEVRVLGDEKLTIAKNIMEKWEDEYIGEIILQAIIDSNIQSSLT